MFLILNESRAQARAGAFLVYGTHQSNLGIGALGEFFVNQQISIVPNVIYFFPKDDSGGKDKWFEINVNGNYYFTTHGSAKPYGLAGLNFSFRTFEFAGGGSATANDIGLNIGVGSDFDIGSDFLPFAEIRFTFSGSDQLVLSGGVKKNIN